MRRPEMKAVGQVTQRIHEVFICELWRKVQAQSESSKTLNGLMPERRLGFLTQQDSLHGFATAQHSIFSAYILMTLCIAAIKFTPISSCQALPRSHDIWT